MKKISRMLVFSSLALILTSAWNKGFILDFTFMSLIKIIAVIALFYYIILPITKLILLPINLLTLGIVSTVVYFILFYFIIARFPLIHIKDWTFPGFSINGFSIKEMQISYFINIILSSVSISFIINILETFI